MTKRHFELFAEAFRVQRVTILNQLKAPNPEVSRLNGRLFQLDNDIDDFCTIAKTMNARFDPAKFRAATHSDKYPQD